MSPKVRERKQRALARHMKTLEHWKHEKSITKDKSRIKYCDKKLERMQFCIDRTQSNLK